MRLRVLLCAFAAIVSMSTVAHAAPTPQQIKCEQKKLRKLGRYTNCIHVALANQVKTGNNVQFATDVASCQTSFKTAWDLQEANAAGAGEECLDGTDTALDFRGRVDKLFDQQGRLLAGQRWKDNGDGTATDLTTGLTWELKTNDSNVHKVNLTFTWCSDADNDHNCDNSANPMDGTVFTQFLQTLNNWPSNCFAGKCDWRLPTIDELSGIQEGNYPAACPFTPPCTTIPGATASDLYWSATTFSGFPSQAMYVDFVTGEVDSQFGGKTMAHPVRAVRGGS